MWKHKSVICMSHGFCPTRPTSSRRSEVRLKLRLQHVGLYSLCAGCSVAIFECTRRFSASSPCSSEFVFVQNASGLRPNKRFCLEVPPFVDWACFCFSSCNDLQTSWNLNSLISSTSLPSIVLVTIDFDRFLKCNLFCFVDDLCFYCMTCYIEL